MSIIIDIRSISREVQQKIVEELIWKKSAYCPFTTTNSNSTIETNPLIGYKRINNDLYLPFAYAQKLLSLEKPNCNRGLQKVEVEYKAKLWENQKPLVAEALVSLLNNRCVQFAIHTGGGKTKMSCYITSQIKEVTAIIAPRDSIARQWLKIYLSDTDIKKEEIALYGSKFPKFKGKIESVKLVIAVYSSLSNAPSELLNRIGMLVLDEAHSLCIQKAVSNILDIHPKYILIATATPSGEQYGVMEAIGGSIYVRKRIDDTKEKTVFKLETGIKVPIRQNLQGKLDWNFTRDFILTNKQRNELILSQVLLNITDGHKILILTFSKEHITTLVNMITKYKISVSTFYHTQTTYKNANVLIGTYSKIKEGFDEENICADFDGKKIDLVIIACPVRKREHLEQSIGRSRADVVTILHLIDDHPTCRSQWQKDNRIVYKQLKIAIEEEDVSEMTLDDVLEGEYNPMIPQINTMISDDTNKNTWKECIDIINET